MTHFIIQFHGWTESGWPTNDKYAIVNMQYSESITMADIMIELEKVSGLSSFRRKKDITIKSMTSFKT